jgi:hypothetical protein
MLVLCMLAGFWSAVSGANDSSGKHTLVPLPHSSTDVCHYRTGGASLNVINTDTGRCRSVNLGQAGVQLAEVSIHVLMQHTVKPTACKPTLAYFNCILRVVCVEHTPLSSAHLLCGVTLTTTLFQLKQSLTSVD